MTVDLRKLIGLSVETSDDIVVGEVIGVDLDCVGWKSVALEVRLERAELDALNLIKPVWGTQVVRISVVHVGAIGETTVRLKRAHSTLKHAITHGEFDDDVDWAAKDD